MSKLLLQKTILITGGTSRLGEAFCRYALSEGAKVYFTYWQSHEKAKELEGLGARGFLLDLSDSDAILGFLSALRKDVRSLSVFIHNAAAVRDKPLLAMDEGDWDYVFRVNLKAAYLVTKGLLPFLEQVEWAKIFFITSRMAFHGAVGAANYAASKAALVGLTKSLAKELGQKKILVNAVNPGFMHSRMTAHLEKALQEHNIALSPLYTDSDPHEVAAFLGYLASDAVKHITGQVLHLESRPIA